jgi:hypothetical protein
MLTHDAIATCNSQPAKTGALFWSMGEKDELDMPERSRRQKRFMDEVAKAGGAAKFMALYKLPGETNYVSQIITGHRPLGERAARNWERKCGWPSGYLDWSDEAGNDEIFQMIRAMPPDVRASIEKHIRTLFEAIKENSAKSN